MRLSNLAIGAVIVGFAIAIAWSLRLAEQNAAPDDRDVAGAAALLGPDTRTDLPMADAAPVTALQSGTSSGPGAADAPAAAVSVPASGSSAGETPVLPVVQLLEARNVPIPPELLREETDFAAEGVDLSWARVAEGDILSRLSQVPGLAASSLQVECRSTKCRLQMASRPGTANPPFASVVESIGYEAHGMMSIIDNSGTLQSVAYLWRDGTEE